MNRTDRVLADIRAEGYEDYLWGKSFCCPYKGKEHHAYVGGWKAAEAKMSSVVAH